jgi:hypothetical protein
VAHPLASSRLKSRWLLAIAAVMVLAVATPLAVILIRGTMTAPPDAVVRDYLNALGRRDATTAVGLLATGGSDLLSAEVVGNPGYHPPRLTEVHTGRVTATTATVTAGYEVDGRPYQLPLTLVRAGGLVPHRWRIREDLLSLPLPPAYFLKSLMVAGTRVATNQTEIEGVFPGGYGIAPPENPIYQAAPLTVVAGTSQAPALTLALRDTARPAIAAQVRQYLDACAQVAELSPPRCPFRAWIFTQGMTSLRWQLITPPALTIQLDPNGEAVVKGASGVVRNTQQGPPGSAPYVQNIAFTLSGVARGDGGKVVFVPSTRPTV